MPLPKGESHTIDDIYSLPDGQRAELIEGRIISMAPPDRLHQDIAGRLYAAILWHMQKNKRKCRPYISPFAVFLNEDRNYVEPDVSVVCDSGKLGRDGCHGAPDWVIEVVSPGSRRMDYYTKLVLYRDGGVREYWIVDPMKETVLLYSLTESEAPVIYHFDDSIPAGIFEGIEICIRDLLMTE